MFETSFKLDLTNYQTTKKQYKRSFKNRRPNNGFENVNDDLIDDKIINFKDVMKRISLPRVNSRVDEKSSVCHKVALAVDKRKSEERNDLSLSKNDINFEME